MVGAKGEFSLTLSQISVSKCDVYEKGGKEGKARKKGKIG